MYSLAWLVVVGVIGAILGGWLGHLVARVRSKAAVRIQELEAELESARGESSEYRREVFDQFAETARKFRSLDESYNDLHRQLAASASLLCGEAAGPLLEAPPQQPAVEPGPEKAAEAPTEQSVEESAEAKVDDESPPSAEDEDVPILVAEVSSSADPVQSNDEDLANGDEVSDEELPRRADDAA